MRLKKEENREKHRNMIDSMRGLAIIYLLIYKAANTFTRHFRRYSRVLTADDLNQTGFWPHVHSFPFGISFTVTLKLL